MMADERHGTRLRVAVLTCSELGIETADALAAIAEIDVVAVVVADWPRATLRVRLRRLFRTRGTTGALRFLGGRVFRRLTGHTGSHLPTITPRHGVPVLHLHDFHQPDALASIARLAPDLAIVDGTYILKESVFALPRLGSINLHCGSVPRFRGTPPAFWELYEGVGEVGITVHRVAARLDAGPILAEDSRPLNLKPPGDPVRYVEQYWRSVLRPRGIAMLGEVAVGFARGSVLERPQPAFDGPPYRTPSFREIRELRRRVTERRSGRSE